MAALVSVNDLAAFLKLDLTAHTATAQQLIDAASETITEYCGWHLVPALTETLTIDGSGHTLQPVPTMNITALAAVTEDGKDQPLSGIDWSVHGVLEKRNGAAWTGRRRGVTVTLTHGFPTAPAWLVTVACALAGRAYLGSVSAVQETSGGESVTYLNPGRGVALLPEERQMLSRLKVT
jgi:hypothetical protein